LTRWVYNNEPAKFAAIELVPQSKNDVPETVLGRFDSDGQVSGGIQVPGVASILSNPGAGTSAVIQGRNAFPADEQPTLAQASAVHLAWDVMIGIGTLLALLSAWYALTWAVRRDLPKSTWFLRVAACAGVLAVIALEAGWVVTEVGRQPWIVRNYMKVDAGATSNGGVWLTFLAIVGIYSVIGVTTVLVLRVMSRRWRAAEPDAEGDVPYGPSEPHLLADASRRSSG
jgi:cytochrome d ubiquinol oxidase subunit I